ncbi:MAG: S8 family serine peptidase [Planctomycetes bacterium]|nr:S8 family serine peptidase [Planctomycetota bacterium]
MRHSVFLASLASLALAAFVPAQGAMLPAPDTFPQPAEGHGAPGRLVEGAEQWLVEFRTRSFDLSALRAARERGASAADVAAIVRSYEQSATRDRAAFTAAVEKLGGRVYENYWIVNWSAIEIAFENVAAVRGLDGVARLTPNRYSYPAIKTATNGANHNSDAVNALGYKGKGIATAIMDTGLDSNSGTTGRAHRTFYEEGDLTKRNRMLANVQVGTELADNTHPHGTGVAGIAAGGNWGTAAADNGHAPVADIVGYSISNNPGGGSDAATMTKAWQSILADAVKHGIKTANNSYSGWSDPLDVTQQALDQCAITGDIMIIVAGGNAASSTLYSQSCANGIAVGAVNANSHTMASFSSRGPLNGDTQRFYPDIAACGVRTVMPQNDNENTNWTADGTSMAAPQVCGAATLLRSAVTTLTAEETKAILLATAQDISTQNSSFDRNAYGMGLLRDDSAMTLAQSSSGWGRATVDSTATTWQRPFPVQAGKTYRAVATWMRQVVTSKAWSDLNVEVLMGSTVLASSKTPRNLYEVAIFKAPATGSVLFRVTGVTMENNKQTFGWAFTEGSGPPLQSEYTKYGTGCPGAAQGCTVGFTNNWTQTLAAGSTTATEIAFMEFSHPVLNVCRADFYMSAKSSPVTVTVRLREYDTTAGAPGKVLGSGTVSVGTSAAMYSVPFSPMVRIEDNVLFFLTIDNTDKLNLPVSSTGTDSYHYDYRNGTWTFGTPAKWQYRVWSDNGLQIPVLSSKDTPGIGKTMQIELASARPSAPAVLVLGFSDTSWGAINLPFTYATGCQLLASGEVMIGLATSAGGTASVPLTLPNSNSLVGLRFYNQFLVVDPVNALGLVASNAGMGLVGDI